MTCTGISTAASFVITTTRKKAHKIPKYPLTGENYQIMMHSYFKVLLSIF